MSSPQRDILNFEYRKRLSPLLKELLGLPCMDPGVERDFSEERRAFLHAQGVIWRNDYQGLANASVGEKIHLKNEQQDALDIRTAEEDQETRKAKANGARSTA